MENGDDQFEIMLRKIEQGEKPTTKTINNYALKSNVTLLDEIVLNRLKDGLNRLSRKEFVEMNQEAVVSLRDAAKFFNYSQDYLRKLINTKKLPAEKKGKLWYIRIRDLEKYIKNLSEE
jgi:excisionase family DNA binding protein